MREVLRLGRLPLRAFETRNTNLGIHNFSSLKLDLDSVLLLSKGIKFIPTPRNPPLLSVGRDLEKFYRRIVLRYHFNKSLPNERILDETWKKPFFVPNPSWNPEDEPPAAIVERISDIDETYYNWICAAYQSFNTHGSRNRPHDRPNLPDTARLSMASNLSRGERLALHRLRAAAGTLQSSISASIVIRNADKNLGLCIMDRSWYTQESTVSSKTRNSTDRGEFSILHASSERTIVASTTTVRITTCLNSSNLPL